MSDIKLKYMGQENGFSWYEVDSTPVEIKEDPEQLDKLQQLMAQAEQLARDIKQHLDNKNE